MPIEKYPVMATFGTACIALFRGGLYKHRVTVLTFLGLLAVAWPGLFFAETTTVERMQKSLGNIGVYSVPLLLVYMFFLCRHWLSQSLGEARHVGAFVHMLLFVILLSVLATICSLLVGFAVMLHLTYFGAKVWVVAVPVITLGLMLLVRLLPGVALAAAGNGFHLSQTWRVSEGNHLRFFAAVILFGGITHAIFYGADILQVALVQQAVVGQSFALPMLSAYMILYAALQLWYVAGIALLICVLCNVNKVYGKEYEKLQH